MINPYIDTMSVYTQNAPANVTFIPVDIPTYYIPIISDKDISQGEITRYFCRPASQSSPSEIQEIGEVTYTSLKSNKFYIVVEIRWKIKGPLEDSTYNPLTKQDTDIKLQTGIISANQSSVMNGDLKLPGLKYVVTNYKKFWQGE